MKMHGGWQFPDADDFMWREMRGDTYQRLHFDAAMTFVTDTRCACDVGAHVGTWTKLMADRFDSVVAVEPASDSFECLRTNMRAFCVTNVVPRGVSLGAEQCYVSLTLNAKETARGNTGGRYVQRGGVILCETLDSWNLPSLGFLKIDAEGSEPDVIKGACFTIDRCKPVVLFEDKGFCTRYGYAKDAPARILTGIGYEHKARVGHDEIWCAA